MFILGILRGISPPKKKILYSSQKTFVSGKSQLLVQRKAFSLWRPLDTLNRGSALESHWENNPQIPEQ